MKYKKIALIGMMGCGKTSVTKELSDSLKIRMFDMDTIFENKYQMSIKDFFKKFSQEKFRICESELLKETVKNDEFILSTGGGIILSEENRKILFGGDIYTIFLSASPEEIFKRLKNDTTRPLLQVEEPKNEVEKILNQRIKYYSMAKKTIDTDNKTIKKIVEEIKWTLLQ